MGIESGKAINQENMENEIDRLNKKVGTLNAVIANLAEEPTLRDRFAMNLPTDEIRELMYNSLSRSAKERLIGWKAPLKESFGDVVEYQLAELDFNCKVNSAIRFKLADTMLQARKEQP